MIVLKILLYILLAVLGIILIVLITPAGGEFSYIDGKFTYKVKLWIFDIMNSEGFTAGGKSAKQRKRTSRKSRRNPKSQSLSRTKSLRRKKNGKSTNGRRSLTISP